MSLADTFFVGENGSGESTVLEAQAMALGYSQEGGTRNVRLETADTVSSLHRSLILLAYPQARIYRFDGNDAMPVAYADTEHFTVIRDLLNHMPRYLREILQDAEPSSPSSH